MTNDFCLDSNIIVKLIIKEVDSKEAELLLTKILSQNSSILSPHFSKYEVFAALRKKAWRKENTESEIEKAINDFRELSIRYINNEQDLEEAYDLARELKLPVIYDCLYLVCAKKQRAAFVTADTQFVKLAKRVYPPSFSLKEVVRKM